MAIMFRDPRSNLLDALTGLGNRFLDMKDRKADRKATRELQADRLASDKTLANIAAESAARQALFAFLGVDRQARASEHGSDNALKGTRYTAEKGLEGLRYSTDSQERLGGKQIESTERVGMGKIASDERIADKDNKTKLELADVAAESAQDLQDASPGAVVTAENRARAAEILKLVGDAPDGVALTPAEATTLKRYGYSPEAVMGMNDVQLAEALGGLSPEALDKKDGNAWTDWWRNEDPVVEKDRLAADDAALRDLFTRVRESGAATRELRKKLLGPVQALALNGAIPVEQGNVNSILDLLMSGGENDITKLFSELAATE